MSDMNPIDAAATVWLGEFTRVPELPGGREGDDLRLRGQLDVLSAIYPEKSAQELRDMVSDARDAIQSRNRAQKLSDEGIAGVFDLRALPTWEPSTVLGAPNPAPEGHTRSALDLRPEDGWGGASSVPGGIAP